jgi:lysyl-tRNA synthetase class 2
VLPHSHALTTVVALVLSAFALALVARVAGRRSRRVPAVAGAAATVAGLASLAATVSPVEHGRLELVRDAVGAGIPDAARVLAVPAGITLVVAGRYLARRHRRALDAAVGAFAVLTVLELVRGPDVVIAGVTAGLAVVLWRARDAFDVEPLAARWSATAGTIVRIGAGVLLATMAIVAAVTWRAGSDASVATILRESLVLLTMARETTLPMPPHLHWLPGAIGVTGISTLLLAVALVFRRPPVDVVHGARRRADALLQEHGTDTLSGFARRADVLPHVTADGRAAGTFAIRAGVLVVGGAPSGPDDAVDELLAEMRGIAEHHDLRMAVLCAGQELADRVSAGTRMRSMYIGDEAVVRPATFTTAGRSMKKVRQAVGRVERAGYTSELVRLGDLDGATRHEVADVLAAWGERHAHGFCMELPLGDAAAADSLAVLARDGTGRVRALVHVVPTPAGGSWSLSSTPHEQGLPNGVVDFLVVRMIEAAGAAGMERVSLNFAAYRQWIHEPANRWERTMGPVVRFLDRFFQIERLYRFNRKFDPEWVPRHLLYDGRRAQLRTMWAAMLVEGQIRPPRLPLADRFSRTPAPASHGPVAAPPA